MGSAAPDRSDAGGDDGLLFALASSLDGAAGAYARAVGLFYETESRGPEGPWLARMQARADRLMAECRMRAGLLAETPARTLAAAATKSRALLRYCETDAECDAQSLQALCALCADLERLAARQAAPGAREPRGTRTPDRRRSRC